MTPTSCRKAVIASTVGGALIFLAFVRTVGHTDGYDGPISETFTARSNGYYGLELEVQHGWRRHCSGGPE